ncbi:hypothetical protein PHLGIDRAFT_68064 [Phlebiopsis gigantea 11061_1 CR5-6]|uniref:Ribosomal RNA-processing protein 8 n=1 Tax=Phlebiopsis gigantea (strain 11061_1 CR5-6) TaxID=745531 RepID=A0A0C3PQ77_PHLG1|nr:hypothetical protein PHLGIDRAFT_68064 [Phlebiopsis gigantea 11061_1 CR5-6]
MALFQVPGWSVPRAPVASSSSHSRKRKRRDSESESKVQSAAVNVEKLFAKLGQGNAEQPKKKNSKGKGKAVERVASEQTGRAGKARRVQPARDSEDAARSTAAARNSKQEKNKKQKGGKPDKSQEREPVAAQSTQQGTKSASPAKGLTALQANMKHSLDGARFRWINETLYKSDSEQSRQMMRENPAMFSEYHTGFRHQVQSWPVNPVSHYISALSEHPARTVIADLGCGDAALARALVPKGYTVLSFDLVSDGAFVVEADICSRVPLPGSEGADDADAAQVADVAVFALSLMSVNWVGAIREVWRILKPGGELKIAEVASRFEEVEAFASLVSSVGFRLQSKDDSNTHFTLFEFTKVTRKPKSDKEWAKLTERGSILKPCEYKRR